VTADAPQLTRLRRGAEVRGRALQDPEVRARWEETALARAVALRLVRYRAEHGLTQTQLAERLGMRQPAIARLEDGEHLPSIAMLYRLARGLGIEIALDIAPSARQPVLVGRHADRAQVVEEVTGPDGLRVRIATT
jgi:transcriptional regulator with XRE-family HTH domain